MWRSPLQFPASVCLPPQRANSHITTLCVAWNKFRREGCKALASGLAGNRGLQTLDLSWNSIGGSADSRPSVAALAAYVWSCV